MHSRFAADPRPGGELPLPGRIIREVAILDAAGLEPLRAAAGSAAAGASRAGTREVGLTGPVSAASPFRIASLTKPLTAVATVLAARRAGTGLDTAALDLLPDLRADWHADRGLTVADILSQTSGLAAGVTGADVAALGDGDSVHLEAARLVVRAGQARPRGRAFEYYNGNYFLAGAVLAALTGVTYEQAMDAVLLQPWSLAATTFAAPASLTPGTGNGARVPAGPFPRGRRPSGGLCSNVTDLLAFGEQLLGQPGLLGQVRAARTSARDPVQYGLGWALGPSGQMYLNGRLPGYRTALMLLPEHRLAGVVLAAGSGALPAAARVLSDLQHDLTGDELAAAIDAFAA